jgi:hypothetical protein
MEAPTPSAAALRVRRHRERCRAGVRCVTIELRATEIGALIRKLSQGGWAQRPSSREARVLWFLGQNTRFVTRNNQADRYTIEKLAHDCLDIRFLRRNGFFGDGWVTVGATMKWPHIAQMRIARYRLILDLRGHSVPQQICVSWTRVHLGGERPWMHCPHCQTRVAKLYAGLGGYFCRACIGNPPYASQKLSAQGRAHFQACKLRLQLDGQAQLSMPFPERPRNMHQRTYDRLKHEGMRREAGLSKRMRRRFPDYASLVAYTD